MFDCSYLLIARKEGVILTPRSKTTSGLDIEKFFRVDHAGERVTKQIYKGQLAVLANHETALEIRHIMDQEL